MRTNSIVTTAFSAILLTSGCAGTSEQDSATRSIQPFYDGYGFISLQATNGYFVRASEGGDLRADARTAETFALYVVRNIDDQTTVIALEADGGSLLSSIGRDGGEEIVGSGLSPGGNEKQTAYAATPGGGGVDLFTGDARDVAGDDANATGGGGIDLFTAGADATGGGGIDLFAGNDANATGGGGIDLFTDNDFAAHQLFILSQLRPGVFSITDYQGRVLTTGGSHEFRVTFATEPRSGN